MKYQEHHFQNVQDIGVAWTHDRVWVCLNGIALFRAKINPVNGELMVEFTPPGSGAGSPPTTP